MHERIHTDLATWWGLRAPLAAAAWQMEQVRSIICEHARTYRGPPPDQMTLLEIGCGPGHHAHFLKHHFAMTLADASEPMLDRSRLLNPELEHHHGDMRSLHIRRAFDVVLIHHAIAHMTNRRDLRQALQTAHDQCRCGGIVVIVPRATRERFAPGARSGGESDGQRALRYLAWTHDPDPDDDLYVVDYAFMLREGCAPVRVLHDHHRHGLFERQVWLDTLEHVGLRARGCAVPAADGRELEVFIGHRP